MVFTDSLVEPVEKVRTVFVAEQQIKLIRKDPCRFSLLPVLDHTVENRIQCDQHAKGHQLFAQLPNIIVDDTALRVDIGFLGKGVQTSVDKQFRRQGQSSGFFLRLEHELSVQVFQSRHLPFVTAPHIIPVHICGAAVKDGFLLCRKVSGSYELLKQGKDKF